MTLAFFNHPLLFGAVAAIAIGVVIYELLKERPRATGHARNTRPPNDRRPPDDRKPPKPTSSPKNTASDNNDSVLRKRYIDQSASKQSSETTIPADSTGVKKVEVSQGTEDSGRTAIFTPTSQDIDKKFDESNYERNVLDKITKDAKDIESLSVSHLSRNIDVEESDSSENNFGLNSEDKVINSASEAPNQACNSEQDIEMQSICSVFSEESFDRLSSLDSELHDATEDTDSDEYMYKKKVQESLKDSIENSNETQGAVNSRPHSSASSVASSFASFEPLTESSKCKACEENPVNTRTQPCNHRYLCFDCAMKVFRLYKRCSICHIKIRDFVIIEN